MRHAPLLLLAACGASAPAAAPAPAPPAPDVCFRDRPVLVAEDVFRDLERFTPLLAEDYLNPPDGEYGACTIVDGVVRSPDGAELARIHCGITVTARGLVDHLGLEIGATGQQVIDGHPDAAARIACADVDGRTAKCWFESVDLEGDPRASYLVDGSYPSDGYRVLLGDAAIAFLAPRTVIELTMRGWCH